MNARTSYIPGSRVRRALTDLLLALTLLAVTGPGLLAQGDSVEGGVVPIPATSTDPNTGIIQAGCSSCGGGGHGGALCGPGALGSGGCGTCCVPGRNYCCSDCSECDSKFGKFFCGLYNCICCPDPCYDPCWLPVADQGFFLDAARPVTQMRLRYASAWNFQNPDRAEWLWARQNTIGKTTIGPDPKGRPITIPGKGPMTIANSVDVQSLSMYTEAAVGAFGLSLEMPYLAMETQNSPIAFQAPNPLMGQGDVSGFGDLIIGTKSMIMDCKLMQMTFGFKTFIPTGNFTKGLGTGHVSLEPSLLFNLCLTERTYLQSQFAYWIPISGDPFVQSNVFHMHFSLNHVLCHLCKGVTLVGNVELNEYTVCGGAYTNPDFLVNNNVVLTDGGATMFSAGPGLRLFVCDKIDFGIGSAFALTQQHFADQEVRLDFRWRY